MSRAEKIRGKLFGGGDKANGNDDAPAVSRSTSDVPLTIQIPKPPPSQPAPPKNKADRSDSSPRPATGAEPVQREQKCFRERLVNKLGADYHGAERFRLVQDGNKELHWKRWGPYLSDRQWVSVLLCIPSICEIRPHCALRLQPYI